MCRLFIVEDEKIMREGIQKNINWSSNNVEVVGTASNGRECLAKIETCMPEVILTDIKMPFMNGMELIQHIYELYPRIKVVLLTAFDEFEYAKKALEYKVCEYVMKYEENDKILKAVLKAGREYKQSLNQIEIMKQRQILLENKVLRELLYNYEKSEEIEENLLNSKIRFPYDYFFTVCILMRNIGENRYIKSIAEGYNLIEEDIRRFHLKVNLNLHFCKTDQKLCMIVNVDTDNRDLVIQFISQLENLLQQKSKWSCDIKASAGNLYKGMHGISRSYEECSHLMSLYQMNQYDSNDEKMVMLSSDDNNISDKKTINQIVSYIDEHYKEKDICLDTIAENVHLTPAYVSAMFKKKKNYNISDYIIKIRIKRAQYLLKSTDMKTYEIADEIGYVNSQYFSVLFKRNTGLSPTEYRHKKEVFKGEDN